MTERQPLPGWANGGHGWQALGRLCARDGQWYIALGDPIDDDYEWSGWVVGGEACVKIAAEDAARALLAELAEALGVELAPGPCGWSEDERGVYQSVCGSEFEDHDASWYTFCPCCGGRVEVAS